MSWYTLLREVEQWDKYEMPPRTLIRGVAERYGEDVDYVKILYREKVLKNRKAVLERLTKPTRLFLEEFGKCGRVMYLARHTGLPTWAIREWLKRRNGRREINRNGVTPRAVGN